MSFWNNPENNSLKVILLVIVVAIAGFFVYKNIQGGALDGAGRVIRPSSIIPSTTSGVFQVIRDGATGCHLDGPGGPADDEPEEGTWNSEGGCCELSTACVRAGVGQRIVCTDTSNKPIICPAKALGKNTTTSAKTGSIGTGATN